MCSAVAASVIGMRPLFKCAEQLYFVMSIFYLHVCYSAVVFASVMMLIALFAVIILCGRDKHIKKRNFFFGIACIVLEFFSPML